MNVRYLVLRDGLVASEYTFTWRAVDERLQSRDGAELIHTALFPYLKRNEIRVASFPLPPSQLRVHQELQATMNDASIKE